MDEDKTPCYFAGAWERSDGWIFRDSAGNTYKETQMYPIPLTPEILEKCGFVKWIDNVACSYKKEYSPQRFIDISNYKDYYRCFIATFKYIHQLQNLYFALTNTELPITL
jgi:hypothetical protein